MASRKEKQVGVASFFLIKGKMFHRLFAALVCVVTNELGGVEFLELERVQVTQSLRRNLAIGGF